MPCIDRNARARLLFQAEALDRRTRLPGQHGGMLKRTGLAVLRALLLQFANVGSGRCDPSYDTLARVAGVCRSTLAKALGRLEAAGLLERVRRQLGCVRYSNAYTFPGAGAPEKGLPKAGSGPQARPDPREFPRSEFRPETTNNKKTKTYSELSTAPGSLRAQTQGPEPSREQGTNWNGMVQGPEVPMAVVLARYRERCGPLLDAIIRRRAEREARARAPQAAG